MIREKAIIIKLILLKDSDLELLHKSLSAFSVSSAICPACHAEGCCTSHGSYSRMLISVHQGSRAEIPLRIPRVICHSCGHTHAILPDVLIPYGSYSLRFILHILASYLCRRIPVQQFCGQWQISVSTLYGWIHLFCSHASLWLGTLETVSTVSETAIAAICSGPFLPHGFFSRFAFSFLQDRYTTHRRSSNAPP